MKLFFPLIINQFFAEMNLRTSLLTDQLKSYSFSIHNVICLYINIPVVTYKHH